MSGPEYKYSYTENGSPLQSCPRCGFNLTKDESIELELAVAGQSVNTFTSLDEEGVLIDTEDNAVANGFHGATKCRGCDLSLAEIAEEHCTEEI